MVSRIDVQASSNLREDLYMDSLLKLDLYNLNSSCFTNTLKIIILSQTSLFYLIRYASVIQIVSLNL